MLSAGIVLAGIILAATTLTIASAHQRAIAAAEENLRGCAQLVAEEAVRAIQGVDLQLQSIAAGLQGQGIDSQDRLADHTGTASMHDALRAQADVLPQLYSLSLLDANGRMVSSSYDFPAPSFNFVTRDYFEPLRQATAPDALHITAPMIGAMTGAFGIHMGRRISAADGGFMGISLASVDLDYFSHVFADAWSGAGTQVSLWRADGTLLLTVPSHGKDARPLAWRTLMRGGGQGLRHLTGGDGVDRIAMVIPLPGYPVLVAVAQRVPAALADWHALAATIGAGGIGCAALVLLLSCLLLRQFEAHAAIKQSVRAQQEAVRGRERAEAQLRQAQKMEAVGQLTAGIAHDFNNLLMAIFGGTDELERLIPASVPASQRAPLALIRQSSERAAALTSQLLAFARQQLLQPRALQLADLFDGMTDLLRSSLGATIEIRRVLPADLWPVYADPTQIEHVILNLAINARDAMPNGGVLRISGDNIVTDATSPTSLSPGAYVRLTIQDNGAGMTADVLARAMDPFFTTKPVGKGSGLGLSQVYGIAHQSGGTVLIDSTRGRGTKLTIFLPRAGEAPNAALPAITAAACPTADRQLRSPAHILVVDDSSLVREAVVRGLLALDYDATAAADSHAALELLRAGRKIDALLVDVVMPGIGGVELARRARELDPCLAVVFMTGHADPQIIGGERWILQKPFRTHELAAILGAALASQPDLQALAL